MANNPIVNGSVVDINSETWNLTGNPYTLVKHYSHAWAAMTATGQDGAVINLDTLIIRNGIQTGYGDTHTFYNVESNVFTFFAEDDRGNVGTDTVELPMVDYVILTCHLANNKPDGDGNLTVVCSGNYFNGSFGAVSNTLSVKCRYSDSSGNWSDWRYMTPTISGNFYTAVCHVTVPDYQQTYQLQVWAEDQLNEVETSGFVTGAPVFHWGKNDFVFEVPVEFKAGITGASIDTIEGDCNITGDLRLKGDGNYGNALYFGDGSYCYLKEVTDNQLGIYADTLYLFTNSLNLNSNSVEYGSWTPTLGVSSSYTTRKGWYQKLGTVVTIGWEVKAYIPSGYHGSTIAISGVPFTPINPAFGGGVAYNVYVTGGLNFECWCLENDGTITARIQPCNNTSAGNLSISRSACYPSGGGEVTVSGTICYMTQGAVG